MRWRVRPVPKLLSTGGLGSLLPSCFSGTTAFSPPEAALPGAHRRQAERRFLLGNPDPCPTPDPRLLQGCLGSWSRKDSEEAAPYTKQQRAKLEGPLLLPRVQQPTEKARVVSQTRSRRPENETLGPEPEDVEATAAMPTMPTAGARWGLEAWRPFQPGASFRISEPRSPEPLFPEYHQGQIFSS